MNVGKTMGEAAALIAHRLSFDQSVALRNARDCLSFHAAEILAVTAEMRARQVNGKNQSPTLVAWADRIDEALKSIGAIPSGD